MGGGVRDLSRFLDTTTWTVFLVLKVTRLSSPHLETKFRFSLRRLLTDLHLSEVMVPEVANPGDANRKEEER